jgi:hypothetical protein
MLCVKGVHRVREKLQRWIFQWERNTCKFNCCRDYLPERTAPESLDEGMREKDIASLFLPFLVAFITWPIGFCREADKPMWLLLSRRCAGRPVQKGDALHHFGEGHIRNIQVKFTAAFYIKTAAQRVLARHFNRTRRQGQLPSGQTAKAHPDYRVQSLHKGHGRYVFYLIYSQ